MQRVATTLIVCVFASIALFGCDAIPGVGQQEAPPPQAVAPPPIQPAPPTVAQPGVVPGQPMPRPAAQPSLPQPQPLPQPATPQQPGMPVAQPQPLPIAPQQPGMPTGQPGVVVPTAQIPTPPVPTGDALTDKLNAKKFSTVANLAATSTVVKRVLKKNKSQDYQVQLPGPPFCHSYIAVGDEKVKNIDLAIVSPTGATEAKDSTAENEAVILNHCPTTPGAYKLSVNMSEGNGEFAVQVYSK